MQNKSLFLKATLGVLILIITFTTQAQVINNANNVSFTSTPTLMSGTALSVGATYKFVGIATGTDAVVTIVSTAGGATVEALDDNNLTMPQAFSPRINLINGNTGFVTFKVDLFVTGTSTPKVLSNMAVTAIDIDGAKDANGVYLLQEIDALNLGAGSNISYQSSNLEIAVTQNGNEYQAINIGGIEYTAVDTSARAVMFTLYNTGVSSFTYRAGGYNNIGSNITRQKAIYFSAFSYIQATLPVTYQSFTATNNNNDILLRWATSKEVNNKYFEVERSFDGRNFTKIAQVEASTNNNIGLTSQYQLLDNDKSLLQNDRANYRLKQVDANGRFNYSNIVSVKLNSTNNISILPNPFIDKLTAQYASNKAATTTLVITNAAGKAIISKQQTANKGTNTIQIDNLSNLATGMYFATLVVDGKIVETKKIIK